VVLAEAGCIAPEAEKIKLDPVSDVYARLKNGQIVPRAMQVFRRFVPFSIQSPKR
jgi:D-arabinose 1-dehydrogenase-like Zn-dependent alcohol dehydrogenase